MHPHSVYSATTKTNIIFTEVLTEVLMQKMLCADIGKNSASIINCERKGNSTIGR